MSRLPLISLKGEEHLLPTVTFTTHQSLQKKEVPSCPFNNKLLFILLNEKQVRPETCNFLRSFETLSSQENLLESPTQSAKWETHI